MWIRMIAASIVYFLCQVLHTCPFVGANYPPPNASNLCFAFDLAELKECMNYGIITNSIVVMYPTIALQRDGYLSLYAGGLVETFNFEELSPLPGAPGVTSLAPSTGAETDLKFWFIFAQPEEPDDFEQFVIQMLRMAPQGRSIFVCLEQGISHFGIQNMNTLAEALHLSPTVLLHLNHERPWRTGDGNEDREQESDGMQGEVTAGNGNVRHMHSTQDVTYASTNELVAAYTRQSLVLRNYYFDPLMGTSVYLPLGAPKYGYMIGNASSHIAEASRVKGTRRRVLCSFEGRTSYSWDVRLGRQDDTAFSIADTSSSHVLERQHLFSLSAAGKVGGCTIIESNRPKDSSVELAYYKGYIQRLVETTFVLCPSGNNAETFRLYEALELGSIPVLIAPTIPSRNYLLHALWKGYPGPVLDNWDELEPFLEEMKRDSSRIDMLQTELQVWYAKQKRESKHKLSAILRYVLTRDLSSIN